MTDEVWFIRRSPSGHISNVETFKLDDFLEMVSCTILEEERRIGFWGRLRSRYAEILAFATAVRMGNIVVDRLNVSPVKKKVRVSL